MRVDIVTLFPELAAAALGESIIGRAQRQGLVTVSCVNLRQFTHDVRQTVDDAPYGGGAGMVMRPEPFFECVEALRGPASRVIMLSPQGIPFRQRLAAELAGQEHLILLCGHYEGVDERVVQALVDVEISIGDFVLTNGAIAAAVVADAILRLVPGVLGSLDSSRDESFSDAPLLEYPQYTRPPEFRGMAVPPVLLSGDHGRISAWRAEQRQLRSVARRPDLLNRFVTDSEYGDPS